ncbi:hypothetical protein OROMI_033202 [Orobanche minor]
MIFDNDSMNDNHSFDNEANNGGSDRKETSQAHDAQGEQEAVLIEQGPQLNMEFESKDGLFNAYQSFAKSKGFCVAIRNYRDLDTGYWTVTKVESVHNHDLDPTFSVCMAPHRLISINTKRQLEKNDVSGLRPCQTIKLLQVEAGGSRNLGCTPKDCRNFIDQRRRLRLGEGDAASIHKLFLRLQ